MTYSLTCKAEHLQQLTCDQYGTMFTLSRELMTIAPAIDTRPDIRNRFRFEIATKNRTSEICVTDP